jgi:BolA protein
MDPAARAAAIERALIDGLEAQHVEVIDDSHRHADHLAAQEGGGHFRVLVVSPRFDGLTRIAAQRLVFQALAHLMTGDIHALQMKTLTPGQWQASVALDPPHGSR